VSITERNDGEAENMREDVTRLADVAPIVPPESRALAEAETARMVAALRRLDEADWSRPTDNTLWDVRAMAGHVLGMTETFSGLRKLV
jgi:mycothiol maleylpyruvate isomerase-like protein